MRFLNCVISGMDYFFREITNSGQFIVGSYPSRGQIQRDEADQFDTHNYEFPYFEEMPNRIIRYVTLRDLEEGCLCTGGRDEPAVEVKGGSKLYACYLLTMICGFVASAFSFTDGLIFIIRCPENWVLPCLLLLMGALGIISLLYTISMLIGKDFYRFRRHEKELNLCFIILLLQWIMDVFILYLKDTRNNSSKAYCSPKFSGYTIITNLIAILAFLCNYILMYKHRKRIN